MSVLTIQEHNLHPDRQSEIERTCADMGITVVIGFAPAAPDGVHRGGVLVMVFDSEATVVSVTEASADLVRLKLSASGREYDVAGVYIPSKPTARLDVLAGLKDRLGPHTLVGGDWNCVPDVTLDVQSPNPLAYANVGADTLGVCMEELGLVDYRREQLELGREHTRQEGSCYTRLDRWYIPLDVCAETSLFNIKVVDDFVWKDCPSDHLAVILEVDNIIGTRGHERRVIREDLIALPSTQALIRETVTKAYALGGNVEAQFTRAHNMMRHELLKLTEAARKRDAPRIKDLRMQLNVLRSMAARNGPSEGLNKARTELQQSLRKLESPEVDAHDTAKAKLARRIGPHPPSSGHTNPQRHNSGLTR